MDTGIIIQDFLSLRKLEAYDDAKDQHCTLITGCWGGSVGLISIDVNDASEKETTTYRKFDKERWYKICHAVTADSIKAFIDSTRVVATAVGTGDWACVRKWSCRCLSE